MTLLPALLGSTWDQLWTPYAALLAIELYSAASGHGSGHLFRLVYNGSPLLVPGCDDTLCDASILLEALSFHITDNDCRYQSHGSPVPSPTPSADPSHCKRPHPPIVYYILCVCLGTLFGAILPYLFRRLQKLNTGRYVSLPFSSSQPVESNL